MPWPALGLRSFRVLVKELQALALDIKVLDADGNEIELASLGEDDIEPMNIVAPVEEEDTHNEDVSEEEYEDDDFSEDDELEADAFFAELFGNSSKEDSDENKFDDFEDWY